MNFIEELKWRNMIQDFTPEIEEELNNGLMSAYVGIDPTADSLHIGHLVSIMMLKHFQMSGHKPIALIGGATGMIGDPSGKTEERKLLDEETLAHNQKKIKKQLEKFLSFEKELSNSAEIVNNYEWMKNFSFLNFIRDIGKYISVNYMMAKDSVKSRLENGISFTEFSYQLIQAYDFIYLFQEKNCKLQMGGSDQWGNITTGTELIRKKLGKKSYGITCPLIKKSDGGKFGKTEKGNIWLDAKLTSPYQFYQFWMNVSDEDVKKYIKIFTLFSKKQVEILINEHNKSPHKRKLQSILAKELTTMIHSKKEYLKALEASDILFNNKGTTETLSKIDEKTFLDVFSGVPKFEISKIDIENKINIIDFLSEKTKIFESKGESRRFIKGGGLRINKQKINSDKIFIDKENLINEKYILVQKGKKNYFLINIF